MNSETVNQMKQAKAIYGFTAKGKEFIYVPNHLVGVGYGEDFNFDWDPNTLEGIALMIGNAWMDELSLFNSGADYSFMDVPQHFLRGFRNICFSSNAPREQIIMRAEEIRDYLSDLAQYERGDLNRGGRIIGGDFPCSE